MIVNDDALVFKSLPEFYKKEKSGVKNNTVRTLTFSEKLTIEKIQNDVKFITIVNTETGESFSRRIRDISKIDRCYVFTWDLGEKYAKEILACDPKIRGAAICHLSGRCSACIFAYRFEHPDEQVFSFPKVG